MSKLKIEGSGFTVQAFELSQSQAEGIRELESISQEYCDECVEDLASPVFGGGSSVYLDDIFLGYLRDFIGFGVGYTRYSYLHDNVDKEFSSEYQSALIVGKSN